MIPLGDIIGTRLVKQIQINYGKVRLWGSVSFIVGSTFVGWTIGEFGHESILWLIIIAVFFNYCLSLIKLNPQLQEQTVVTLLIMLLVPCIGTQWEFLSLILPCYGGLVSLLKFC